MNGGQGTLLLALLLTLGLAGCTESTSPPSPTTHPGETLSPDALPIVWVPAIDAPSDSMERDAANPRSERKVYQFEGWVAGPSVVVAGSAPIASQESFTAPNGTTALVIQAKHGDGVATLSIDILDAKGRIVYASSRTTTVGAAETGVFAGSFSTKPVTASQPPGTYTVRYHVQGAVDVSMTVTAILAEGRAQ